MKMNALRWLMFLQLGLWCVGAHAGSFVWQVSKGVNTVFIGGTIHVLGDADYPLPPAFDVAYNKSSVLFFEADIAEMNTPAFQAAMMRAMTYSDGSNLKSTLQSTTYRALEAHFKDRGIGIDRFDKFKPSFVSIALTALELQRLSIAGEGVDAFYQHKAINDNKAIFHLESIQEQLGFIASMGKGSEDDFILYTLRDIKNLSSAMKQMKAYWRSGNSEGFNADMLIPLKTTFPEIYEAIIVERNNDWLPKIETLLATKETEFVLVGALHLIGNEGVIAQLKARGYTLKQL